MIVLAFVIVVPAVVCFAAGYQIGRTVEYFACQRDRDRREP